MTPQEVYALLGFLLGGGFLILLLRLAYFLGQMVKGQDLLRTAMEENMARTTVMFEQQGRDIQELKVAQAVKNALEIQAKNFFDRRAD